MWKLTWALHADEHPLPSSIVGQLETEEMIGSHKLRIRNSYWSLWLLLLCYVFTLTVLHHKQHYYRTASFLYCDPTTPHLLLLTIWRRYYLRYKDLFHCTFPSVIQGPLSLYDYIGIWDDTIYPHTPTSSTIHIGLAYVGTHRSSI